MAVPYDPLGGKESIGRLPQPRAGRMLMPTGLCGFAALSHGHTTKAARDCHKRCRLPATKGEGL
jgi:hypothetical protein